MKQTNKKLFLLFALLLMVGFFLYQVRDKVLAEQSGSSPESGVTSRIKTIYDSLVSLTHGSDSAGGWGNWGVMWNRIRSAAEWVPDSGLSPSEVADGETFYSGSRSAQTGTALPAVDFTNQQYSSRDDYGGPNGSGAEDYRGEESTWTNPATNVWKDSRTGVYWSANQGSKTNSFTAISLATCDFFTTTPRGAYTGGDSDCGVAINYCATLDLASGGTSSTDWYLPSYKELQQASVDGMYNKAGTNLTNAAAFTTTSFFWSSTEASDFPNSAWLVYLNYGVAYRDIKSGGLVSVRCVRRD